MMELSMPSRAKAFINRVKNFARSKSAITQANDVLKTPFDDLRDMHNGDYFRVPRDLRVTPTNIRRGLVIGSCVAENLAHEFQRRSGIEHDYVMFHNPEDLERSLPRKLADYDYTVISLALRFTVPEREYNRLQGGEEAYRDFFEVCKQRLMHVLIPSLKFNEEHGALTFVCDFFVPQQNPIGRLQAINRYSNISFFIGELNRFLYDEIARRKNCYVLSVDAIAATIGKKHVTDENAWQFNHGAVMTDWDAQFDLERLHTSPLLSEHFEVKADRFFGAVWAELESSLRTVRQQDAVKLVIVDLDDTMWRGIIGEDRLSVQPIEGWPLGFAEALLYLKKRGIILAIASKNEEETVRSRWSDVFLGFIELDDFAVTRINWRPKIENVGDIIRAVNVLPSSVLFIDDNPAERASVQVAYPGIRTLGANPYYLKRILTGAPELQMAKITSESAAKTDMIRAQIKRDETRNMMSPEDFLKSLNLEVIMTKVQSSDHEKFPRALELLNKTNQFNTTGKRWSHQELDAYIRAGGSCLLFDAEDRFTRYGMIAVGLASNVIDQIVMSCRVIGMEVEKAVISKIEDDLQSRAKALAAAFISTPSNNLCKGLFPSAGYELDDSGNFFKPKGRIVPMPGHIAFRNATPERLLERQG
jgi:FkbH-like protein